MRKKLLIINQNNNKEVDNTPLLASLSQISGLTHLYNDISFNNNLLNPDFAINNNNWTAYVEGQNNVLPTLTNSNSVISCTSNLQSSFYGIRQNVSGGAGNYQVVFRAKSLNSSLILEIVPPNGASQSVTISPVFQKFTLNFTLTNFTSAGLFFRTADEGRFDLDYVVFRTVQSSINNCRNLTNEGSLNQGSVALRPTFIENRMKFVNGQTMTMPGNIQSLLAGNNHTLFIVARITSNTQNQHILSVNDATSSRYNIEYNDINNTNKLSVTYQTSSGAVIAHSSVNYNINLNYSHVVRRNNNNLTVFIDNNSIINISNIVNFTPTNAFLGTQNGSLGSANVEIKSIVIYNRSLTDVEIQEVNKFLKINI